MQTDVQSICNISDVILDQRPGSNPLGGLKGWGRRVKTFSEHGHVAY